MKSQTIDLIRNKKLKIIAIKVMKNGMTENDLNTAMQIAKKIKAKSESDNQATAALIWMLRSEEYRSLDSEKKAIVANVLEKRNKRSIGDFQEAAIERMKKTEMEHWGLLQGNWDNQDHVAKGIREGIREVNRLFTNDQENIDDLSYEFQLLAQRTVAVNLPISI